MAEMSFIGQPATSPPTLLFFDLAAGLSSLTAGGSHRLDGVNGPAGHREADPV